MTFFTFSLGCKVNSYENNAIKEMFIKSGMSEDSLAPNIVLINTCSVTAVADQKSRQHIRKFRRMYPNSILVVMGCYSQKNADVTLASCGANIVLGTSKRNKILEYIDIYQKDHINKSYIDEDTRSFTYESFGVFTNPSSTRAYIKIEDGCNNFCTYCTIPYTRGIARSRNKDEIISEIKYLISKGFKEFVLTGIHTAHYGLDLDNYSFSDLVEEIINIPDLYRLRISSIEESEIDDKFIDLLKHSDKLANHLHLPLQSGSASVLKRMNRKYEVDDFINKVERIRKVRPDIALTTDVIVGFPGETNEEFKETLEFIKRVNFSELHVFPFSARKGTIAATLDNQVDEKTKSQRVETLIALGDELHKNYMVRFVGKEVEIVVEGKIKKTGYLEGFTSNYLKLALKLDESYIGEVVKAIFELPKL